MSTLLPKRWFNRSLSCKDVNAFLADYIEDALEPKTKKKFEQHINRCPNCHTYLDQYQATVSLLHGQPKPAPPQELINHTLAFLRTHLNRNTP